MPYLTYEEYKELGFTDIEETEFERLLKRASDVIDGITRHFYRFDDIENDVPFRREQFKKAIAAQIEYFYETGSTHSYGMNEPQSVSIGRTSMTTGSNPFQNGVQNDLICKDVYFYLKDTGLLYTGIGVV